MSLENRIVLERAREAIPFLREIPDEIYFALDHREFVVPDEITAIARRQLEESLNHHVMTYNRHVFLKDVPIRYHLCAHLEGAKLTAEQRQELDAYEERFKEKGVSFVVYQKPLTIMPIERSYIYKVLQEEKHP